MPLAVSCRRALRQVWPWLLLIVAASCLAWSWFAQGIVFELLRTDLDAAEKIARLQAFFDSWGPAAPLVYTAFVVIEVVVAPIPGLMLYAPGGLIFGPFWGGALSLLGNTLGAGLAATLAQRLGATHVERWAGAASRVPLQEVVRSRGAWWIFWLRLNPLTSSDVVSYAAGLAAIPTRRVMFATACGMTPLCFAQSALSDDLFRRFPQLLYPLLSLCAVYLVVAAIVLRRQLAPSPEVIATGE